MKFLIALTAVLSLALYGLAQVSGSEENASKHADDKEATQKEESSKENSKDKAAEKTDEQGQASSDEKEPPPLVNKLIGDREKLKAIEKKEEQAVLRHKQMYFAYGVPITKIQFSFKSPMIENIPAYFAYSQVIFWRLREDSKPFEDATYNPEIFYRYGIKGSDLKSIDLGAWEHNSNGKKGPDSRSYDQSYLRLNYAFESASWITEVSGKMTYIYNQDETNQDIYEYISPFEFSVRFIQLFDSVLDKGELTLDFKPGGRYGQNWHMGGYQVGFSFRLGGLKVVPAFYLQYYHGYAETLINYNEKVDQYRAGFIF